MSKLSLTHNETVIRTAWAQLAKGFPQTVGKLHLTNQRIILVPNQILSIFFGKKVEIPLVEIQEIKHLGHFEGGTFAGGAGQKIFIKLKNSDMYTFSFLFENVLELFKSCEEQISNNTAPKEEQ
ncbi:hypothetical protein N9403_00935 [Gammaproteobacteria bacterium]|nr:hypothetical protein [Gammaproteobacteria bacterium]